MANKEADMFTKKLAVPEHNKHAAKLCECHKYYNTVQEKESHEQGRVPRVAEHSHLEKHNSSRSRNTIN